MATRFDYAVNERTVVYIIGEEWNSASSPTNYLINFAREFRYDGARQRYLVRELDPVAMMENPTRYTVVSDTWSDYDGDDIYGDFTISGGVASPVRSFEPGMGKFDWMDDGFGTQVPDDTTVAYYHTNQIGTTRLMTDSVGAPGSAAAYTAFGERISGTNYRYGYAGAWGYQAHTIDEVPPPHDPDTVFPYRHVGHRYYDPATGRFLQRDPIGLWRGLNVYEYVWSAPAAWVDPWGLSAAGAALGPAAIAAGADGPFPIGDAIGCAMILGGLIYDLYQFAHRKGKRKSTRDKHTKTHSSKTRRGRRKPKGWSRHPGWRPTCFTEGTSLLTDNGKISIEEARTGSSVLCARTTSTETTECTITAVHTSMASELVLLTIDGETIACTSEHPFWLSNIGWVTAGTLNAGDELLDSEGHRIAITRVAHDSLCEPVRVYNLTVSGSHTYFVGESHVLVHNKKR